MRTAQEIILTKEHEGEKHGGVPLFNLFDVMDAINEARNEAIQECAERAKSEWVRYGTQMGHEVDKKSILDLIDELK